MPATRRSGVKTRPLPDWYASDLSGAFQSLAACPAHYQVYGLYNDARDGSILKVYAVDLFTPTTSTIYFNLVQGNPGTVIATTWGSIDPLVGKLWGLPITVGLTVQIGQNIGGLTMQATVPRLYAPGWPIAVIQPGWSFLLHPNAVNTEQDSTIWWLNVTS
jgi:hypothetical protein